MSEENISQLQHLLETKSLTDEVLIPVSDVCKC